MPDNYYKRIKYIKFKVKFVTNVPNLKIINQYYYTNIISTIYNNILIGEVNKYEIGNDGI